MSVPEQALALWGLEGAETRFVAGRENRVYRVNHGGRSYALRLRRAGYRRAAEMVSELDWMAAMGEAGLVVPRPVTSLSGRRLERLNTGHADLLTWLEGVPLGATGQALALNDGAQVFRALGRLLAQLHAACDGWEPPEGFARCHWDLDGLLGDSPVWGRFWENPGLLPDTRALLEQTRQAARADLRVLELDQGLIHADPVRENVLVSAEGLRLIDFDDGGFGYRLFDIATALIKNRQEPDYNTLRAELIAGYQSLRPLDTTHLDLFLALRAMTYLGWIIPRLGEEGSAARNQRFVTDATALCSAYLARRTQEGST